LRDLGAQALGVEDVEGSCTRAMDVLAQYSMALPFCALYVVDPAGNLAHRAALSCPMPEGWFPREISLPPAQSSPDPWSLRALCDTGGRQSVDDLPLHPTT